MAEYIPRIFQIFGSASSYPKRGIALGSHLSYYLSFILLRGTSTAVRHCRCHDNLKAKPTSRLCVFAAKNSHNEAEAQRKTLDARIYELDHSLKFVILCKCESGEKQEYKKKNTTILGSRLFVCSLCSNFLCIVYLLCKTDNLS